MIVTSAALAASPNPDEPLNHPVLCWQNVAQAANVSTTTEEVDYPASHLANPSTNLSWMGIVASPAVDEYITVTLAGEEPIDYVAVARHNFGSAGIAASVEVLLSGSSPDDWDEVVAPITPTDDAPLILRFVSQEGSPFPIEALRLRLQPGSEAPEAAVLFVGKSLVFERGVIGDFTPLPMGRIANVVTGRSEMGDFLGRIVTGSHLESSARFAQLTPTWVREYLDPFLAVQHEQPFFFAWQPEDFPSEVGFAWLRGDPRPSFDADGFVAIDFEMSGIVQ